MSETKSMSKTPIFVALILLLLIVNGILFYSNQVLKQEGQDVKTLLEEEKQDIQNEYNTVLEELETYKIENAEKDSTLAEIQTQIDEQKGEIERLLRKGRATKDELSQAKNLLASLRITSDDYKQQIANLEYQNRQLTAENTNLKTNVTQQSESISKLQTEKEGLLSEKTTLISEKMNLAEEKSMLDAKVNRASVMQVTDIVGTGVFYKKNGKEIETENYKKADKLRICFDMLSNTVATLEPKEILLSITSPEGDILSVQALGSGTFTTAETGEETKYTTKAQVPYKGKDESYCIYWEQNSPFIQGVYTAELYNQNYVIGNTSFELKKSGLF